jgi:hypothetical protein
MLERHSVSFVSVTQHLNTADSVGRLSLNILLSFAQFEREIASERIREKILASRRRGLWTGGNPPLGYDAKGGALVINEEESERVRHIFRRYVELGSVNDLRLELQRDGIHSKARRGGTNGKGGPGPLSRGALYTILRNVLYRGKIRCGKSIVEAVHQPIVPADLWLAASQKLASGCRRRGPSPSTLPKNLLGKIFDSKGRRITRSFTYKNGKKYCYYATAPSAGLPREQRVRIPCEQLDEEVNGAISRCIGDANWLFSNILTRADDRLQYAGRSSEATTEGNSKRLCPEAVMGTITRVTVDDQFTLITLSKTRLRTLLLGGAKSPPPVERRDDAVTIRHPFVFRKKGKELCAIVPGKRSKRQRADDILVDIVRARSWFAGLCNNRFRSLAEIAAVEKVSSTTISRRITLAFLSPAIESLIRRGQIPDFLDREWVRNKCPLPEDWSVQRQLLLRQN